MFIVVAAAMDGATAFPGHRLTLTPRADSQTRHRRSTGDGGGTFDMVATAGFDLSAAAIEVCTSATRCITFGQDTPGWRAGDPVPDAAIDGGPRQYWWGHDENSTLNLITHGADDRVFGSMVDGSSLLIYSFGYDAEGATLVHATHTDQFTELPPHGHDHDEEDALPADPSDVDGPSRQRRGDDGSQLDVMVLWTVNAECANSGQPAGCTPTSTTFNNMLARMELAVAETNTACERPPPALLHLHLQDTLYSCTLTPTSISSLACMRSPRRRRTLKPSALSVRAAEGSLKPLAARQATAAAVVDLGSAERPLLTRTNEPFAMSKYTLHARCSASHQCVDPLASQTPTLG